MGCFERFNFLSINALRCPSLVLPRNPVYHPAILLARLGAGIGVQNVMDFAEKQPELFLKNSRAAKDCEEKASVRVQSMFSAQPGETFSGEDIYQAMALLSTKKRA